MLLLADRGFCGFPLVEPGGRDRRGSVVAGEAGHEAPSCRDPRGRVVAGRAATGGQRRTQRRAVGTDPGDRLRDRRRPAQRQHLPAVHHDARSRSRRPPRSSPWRTRSAGRSKTAFDELKVHQRGARTVLRSKSPDLVLQEIWGHLCCHYAIRTLMWEAAGHAGVDPDRVSFVAALRIAAPLHLSGARFPPARPVTDHGWRHAISAGLPATQPGPPPPQPTRGSSNASTSSGT